METTSDLYRILRAYHNDLRTGLPSEINSKLDGYIRSRSFRSLAECTCLFDAAKHDVTVFRVLFQVSAMFKKNSAFTDVGKAHYSALKTFVSSEAKCAGINVSIENAGLGPLGSMSAEEREIARQYISNVLGEFSVFFDSLPKLLRVTSGASDSASRSQSLPHLKLSRRLTVTKRARPYVEALAKTYGVDRVRVKEVFANRVEFVPKSWKTHRSIACEPVGNLPLQLAFDSYVKSRLLQFGINLRDQDYNKDLARRGSIDGSYATIDLKSASDLISYLTVVDLIPTDWFQYLDDVRSPFWKYQTSTGRTRVRKYEKFSSMGNGATFALETLLFAALTFASGSRDFCVYGDDIAVDTAHAKKTIENLESYGFEVNQEKSYTTGPFRESCGGNYFLGVDVTPFYVRDLSPSRAVRSHNVNGIRSVTEKLETAQHVLSDMLLGLPLIPPSYDTCSGVFVTSKFAYESKLVYYDKRRPWVPFIRALSLSQSSKPASPPSASLFHWFLTKSVDVGRLSGEDVVTESIRYRYLNSNSTLNELGEVSKVPVGAPRWRTRRVRWIYPSAGTCPTIYSWTDVLSARKGR
jgi:hypothetical protein